jgi:hypothetical protein
MKKPVILLLLLLAFQVNAQRTVMNLNGTWEFDRNRKGISAKEIQKEHSSTRVDSPGHSKN